MFRFFKRQNGKAAVTKEVPAAAAGEPPRKSKCHNASQCSVECVPFDQTR